MYDTFDYHACFFQSVIVIGGPKFVQSFKGLKISWDRIMGLNFLPGNIKGLKNISDFRKNTPGGYSLLNVRP